MLNKEALKPISISILEIKTCPSLSSRSQLTYHIGYNSDGDILLKVASNSANGQFNAEWIYLSVVEQLLSDHPLDKHLTSSVLRPMFLHKSSNSPSFYAAILLAESIILPGQNKDSGFIVGDIEGFKQAISALIASDTNLETAVTASPEVTKRKRKE